MTEKTEKIDNCTVFISYQWGSQDKVKKLYQALSTHVAIKPWMDIYSIKAGMNLFQSLATNIQSCDVILSCVSKKYVQSKNCEREVIYADCFNKPIIPLYLEKLPIAELGSIGFLLARERYCSLHKDEKIFENLITSDVFIDILNGIEQVLKSKGKIFKKPLSTKKDKPESLIEIKNDEVIQFRNDQPLTMVVTAPLEEKEENEQINEEENESKNKLSETSDIIVEDYHNEESRNKNRSLFCCLKKSNNKVADVDKDSIVNKTTDEKINTDDHEEVNSVNISQPSSNLTQKKLIQIDFEIHPLVKELEYLRRPKILLDARGDRIFGEITQTIHERGGLPYYKPIGWQRIGLDVSLLGYPDNNWLAKDGNPDEWCVAYHGIKSYRYLQSILFEDNVFSPNFKAGISQLQKLSLNINKKSDTFNKQCGLGVYFSSKISIAKKVTKSFIIRENKYKVVLQCRLNPSKTCIPEKAPDLYIVNRSVDIRPYGILVRKVIT